MDPAQLAPLAVGVLIPWLQQTGSKALDKLQGTAVDAAAGAPAKIYGWLKEKLAGRPLGAAALAELPGDPGDEAAKKALESQIAKLLGENEALRAELERMLPPETVVAAAATQTATAVGNQNIIVQNTGSGSVKF